MSGLTAAYQPRTAARSGNVAEDRNAFGSPLPKPFQIHFESNDLGQLLDGLRGRADAWLKTAEYLSTGHVTDESFVCEECSDPQEAKSIAQHYEKIINQIEQQVQKQGGWS
jgi:hypothetical protein